MGPVLTSNAGAPLSPFRGEGGLIAPVEGLGASGFRQDSGPTKQDASW